MVGYNDCVQKVYYSALTKAKSYQDCRYISLHTCKQNRPRKVATNVKMTAS